MYSYYQEIGMVITEETSGFVKITDSEFLSTKFTQVNGVWLPLMNRDKIFSSLMVGDDNPDPRWVLMRVFAYRIECWSDKEFIKMLLDFEQYLYRRFRRELVGEFYVGRFETIITMDQIMSMRLSDRELQTFFLIFVTFVLHRKL